MIRYQDSRVSKSEIDEIFSTESRWQAWLDVEVALAQAQAELGIIPEEAAGAIAKWARIELLDRDGIETAFARTSHILVALVWELSRKIGEPHGGWVHWGATTQNIVTTGDLLVIRKAQALIRRHLEDALDAMAELAERGADMPMAGRTHGQHAVPITFGVKPAGWIDEILRHLERLDQAEPRNMSVLFGGAAGTYASLGEMGPPTQAGIAERLGMTTRAVPSRAIRDASAENVCILGLIAATCGRIGREVYNLMRTEYGEVEEPVPDGMVGSSTMPQKRNPKLSQGIVGLAAEVRSTVALALESNQTEHEADATTTIMIQPAEQRAYAAAEGMLKRLVECMRGLTLKPERMLENLQLGGGLIMAESVMLELGKHLGRQAAHDIVYDVAQDCVRHNARFSDLLAGNPEVARHLSRGQIETLLDARAYTGLCADMAREAAARVRQRRAAGAA